MQPGDDLRRALIELVQRWQRGEVDGVAVRDEAEDLEHSWGGRREWDTLPLGTEPIALRLAVDVLTSLSSLHLAWITRDDIPAMLEALQLADTDATTALERWTQYNDSIDWDVRGTNLRDDPRYVV